MKDMKKLKKNLAKVDYRFRLCFPVCARTLVTTHVLAAQRIAQKCTGMVSQTAWRFLYIDRNGRQPHQDNWPKHEQV